MSYYRGTSKLRILQVPYHAGENSNGDKFNQLLALLKEASPILATLTKDKNSEQIKHIQQYLNSSVNSHWKDILKESQTPAKQAWDVGSVRFREVSFAIVSNFWLHIWESLFKHNPCVVANELLTSLVLKTSAPALWEDEDVAAPSTYDTSVSSNLSMMTDSEEESYDNYDGWMLSGHEPPSKLFSYFY